MLTSRVKGVKDGYPLRILVSYVPLTFYSIIHLFFLLKARKVELVCVEFNSVFIQRMMQKINWDTLKGAADSVSILVILY